VQFGNFSLQKTGKSQLGHNLATFGRFLLFGFFGLSLQFHPGVAQGFGKMVLD
jgi:hypothetical protein